MLPIPRGAMKQIKLISEEAKIPASQVFEDVIENGLHTVRGMYASLINFRKERAKLNEQKLDDAVAEDEQPQDSELEPGDAVPGFDGLDGAIPDDFRDARATEERHRDDPERPGLRENGEGVEVFDESLDRD